jgi:hypothetical protein
MLLILGTHWAVGQSPRTPAFDGASVKPGWGGTRARRGGFRAGSVRAYQLKPYQFTPPDWMQESWFQIDAVPEGTAKAQELSMEQHAFHADAGLDSSLGSRPIAPSGAKSNSSPL